MRIIQLTPGTGSFYCGTCLRDNALVAELRRQGHDALLVPLYLPLVLDEPPATPDAPLFFGGINVYLQQKAPLLARLPRALRRWLDAPALLRAAAARAGMTDAHDLGELTLSMLRGEEGRQTEELDRLAEWLADEARPEVVCLSNALLVGLASRIRKRTGAAIVCMLQGEDSFLDALPEPFRSRAWQTLGERARHVDRFAAVSRYYAARMIERARLPAERVAVVYPGIAAREFAPPPAPPHPPVIGYLARMCPAKGLHTLVEAYLLLRGRNRVPPTRLHVAGSVTPADRPFVERLRRRLAEQGLEADCRFLPDIDRKAKLAFLQGLTVFSVPATYGEAFGLYVLEALATGVPVVQPRHGAFPELLEATGGGILCEPDDPESLATAIEELLLDPAAARALGERGRAAVAERFTVERAARETLALFEEAIGRRREAA